MGRKISTKAFKWWIGAALCAVAFGKLLIQYDSTRHPDPATGHTEQVLFAPSVSTSWSYATQWQVVLLAIAMCGVLLMVLAWGVLELRNRLAAPADEDADSPPAPVLEREPAPSSEPRPPARHRPFGRAGLKRT